MSSPPVMRRALELRRFTSTYLCVFALLGLLGCEAGGGGQAGAGGAGGAGGPPQVSVAPAVKRQVQEFDEFNARLEAVQTVDLRSRVSGTLEQAHFREGQRVSKGELLFSIDARPFLAEVARVQAQIAAVQSQLTLTRSEVQRAEKLVAIQGISAQELDQLRAAVRNAEANLKAGEAQLQVAQLNLGYTRVTSPISGRVSRANVTPGNLVNAGDVVLTSIVSMDKVYAWFDASEAQFLKYQKSLRDGSRPSAANGTAAAPRAGVVSVSMGLADEPGHPHSGSLDFVDNRLNPATATIRVRAVFDNTSGRFTPGLSARIKLGGGGAYEATMVPDRAIGTDQTRKIVLGLGPNNIVTPREVKLGALIDGMRVVQGINPGDTVIVDGLQRAFPGAPVTPLMLKVDTQGMPLPPAPAAPASAASSKP